MKYLAVLVLLMSAQDQKLPVPSAAEQKKADAEIRSVFKEDFAKKTRDGKRALAQKLLKEAGDEKNTAVARYVVLQLSRDLAVESLDLATLFSSIEQLGKLYDVEKPLLTGATFTSSTNALKVSGLNSAQKFASSPEDSSALGEAYLKVAEDTLKDHLFDDALSAAQAAERYGKSAKAAAVAERAGQMTKEIPELKKEDESFANIITSKADDPGARLIKGRYTLFVVGDERAGIENLLGCSDDGLKNVARLEAAKPSTAEPMVDVAEAWLALSGKEDVLLHKRRYKNRARGWFDEAMKNAGGITKAKIEHRLAELGKSDTASSGSSGMVLDLLKIVSPKDSVHGTWTLSGQTLNMAKGEYCRLQLPYVPGETEYDLTITVQHQDGGGHFAIGLAYGKRQFTAELDGTPAYDVSGFQVVDAKGYGDNETTHKGKALDPKSPSTIVCAVRRTGVTVTVDGKPVTQYKGDYARLTIAPTWEMPNKEAPFLGAWNSGWTISKLTLRQITGKGKLLR